MTMSKRGGSSDRGYDDETADKSSGHYLPCLRVRWAWMRQSAATCACCHSGDFRDHAVFGGSCSPANAIRCDHNFERSNDARWATVCVRQLNR